MGYADRNKVVDVMTVALAGLGRVTTMTAACLPDGPLACGKTRSAAGGVPSGADAAIALSAHSAPAVRDVARRFPPRCLSGLIWSPVVRLLPGQEGIGW
jgi:hypothetical protein